MELFILSDLKKIKIMKKIVPNKPCDELTFEQLHEKVQDWLSEIEFILVEQKFLNEIIVEHTLEICNTENYAKAKLFIRGIEHENKLGKELIEALNKHRVNIDLFIENIYVNKEKEFRNNHKLLKLEVSNYIENFKYIKQQVFDLILFVMKNEKQQRLLS